MITRIERRSRALTVLVGELLTLSRLETGEMPPLKEEVDMHDLVRDVVHDANFEAQAQEREVILDDQGSAILQGLPSFCTAPSKTSSAMRSNMPLKPDHSS